MGMKDKNKQKLTSHTIKSKNKIENEKEKHKQKRRALNERHGNPENQSR